MKTIIGIDPGASGGIAVCHRASENPTPYAIKMPETDGDLLKCLRDAIGVFEVSQVTVFMEQLVKHMGVGTPASTMAVYAANWGMVKGIVMALGARLQIVTPHQWQKELGLGITGRQKANTFGLSDYQARRERQRITKINSGLKRDWKNKLKGEAQRLYPGIEVTLNTADALLILEYGRRQQFQQKPTSGESK